MAWCMFRSWYAMTPVVSFLGSPVDLRHFRDELVIKCPSYNFALWELSPGGRYTAVEMATLAIFTACLVSYSRKFSIQSRFRDVTRHEPLVLRSPTTLARSSNLRSN
jgi:hypothetical protein